MRRYFSSEVRKLKKHKQKHKPNHLIRKGSETGKEKLKENLRETAERSRTDTPEEYGGDKLSESAEFVEYKAKETVRDGGQKIKEKATEKLRDKLNHEKPKEKNEPYSRESREESHREYSAKERPEPKTERRETKTREKTEQKADTRESTTSERSEKTMETRDTRIKEKPEYNKESVKTKDNYIRSHNEPQIAEQKKELPKTKTESPQKPTQTTSNASKPQSHASQNHGMKTVRSTPQHTTSVTKTAGNAGKGTVKTAGKGTIKTVSKGTVKTAQAGVKTTKAGIKTAETTAKATAKTAKTAGHVAQKAAQAAAKAAQAIAKAAATAAKVAAKAIATAVKAIVTAIKGIIAAIAAGGWIAVIIIVAICVIALIVCACCGVFASNETEDGSRPMTEAIQTIDGEFRSSIDSKIADLSVGNYDAVEVKYVGDMDGDSDFAINWNDAIAIYAVSVTMDPEAPTDVVQVTPEKVEILRRIFNEMNTVSYSTDVVETERTIITENGNEETETIRKLIISVDVSSMDAYAAAEMYSFTEDQMEALEAMMEPQMLPLYAELVGVDVYGGADLTKIISNLPPNSKGSEVVKAAVTKLGAPYVLGAKGDKKFDCSGLAYWAINQVDPELGGIMYTNAAGQAKYCYNNNKVVGESELLPGDLVFWQNLGCDGCHRWKEVHHVGIYMGDGKVIEASSSKGRVVIRDLWSSSGYPLFMYGRPY